MLASVDWLKQYVDIDVTPEELAEKLTRVGLEVESVNPSQVKGWKALLPAR